MAVRTIPILATLLATVSACSSSRPEPEPLLPVQTVLGGTPITFQTGVEMFELAALEDRRTDGDGRLYELAGHDDPAVRARAAEVLGRLPYPDFGAIVTSRLAELLEDPDRTVRLEAVFALGARNDPGAVSLLLAYRNEPEAELRAAVIAAASLYDVPSVRAEVVIALRDSALEVQCQAVEGTARWNPTEPGAEAVDRALVDALSPHKISETFDSRERARGIEPELSWRILYSLARRRSALGRGAFLEYLGSDRELEQLFAVRGLGRIAGDAEIVKALIAFLRDDRAIDWRMRYEAVVALGVHGDAAAIPLLLRLAKNASVHVRAASIGSLASFPDERTTVLPVVRQGLIDVSASVRVAAFDAIARLLEPEEALKTLGRNATSDDPVVRAGVAAALEHLPSARSLDLLARLAEDPSLRVATTAVSSIGAQEGDAVRPLLHRALAHDDNGLRLAAVLALRKRPDRADLELLERAFTSSEGDVSNEIAFNVLQNLGEIGGERAEAFVTKASGDPRSHVRRVARQVLEEKFGTAVAARQVTLEAEGPPPFPGRGFPRWQVNPVVELSTTRGALVFELFPTEAPQHVYNFLRLLEEGAYDGLDFHRVVPDFVIQGGDYRGDGNGGRPWRGSALRHEWTPQDFVRGSLGMPRNEDPDSGGSQFFVTQRPTPHLTGRYTLFGQLRDGFEILDRIEVGDRILGARILDPRRGKGPPRPPGGP